MEEWFTVPRRRININSRTVFDEECILDIFNRGHIRLNRNISLVFVTIDPAAGTIVTEKPTSEFAVVSMAAPNIFLGIESWPVKTHHDWDDRLMEHFDRLLANDRLKAAHFVVAVEANNDHSPSIIYEKLMKRFPNKIIPYSSNTKSGKLGTFTTAKSKVNMIELTQAVVVSKNMWFTEDIVCTDPNGVDKIKALYEQQFLRFSREVHISKDGLGRSTVMYTGQLRKGEMDDGVMTSMRNVLLQFEFFQNKSYENYWYYRD